MFLLLCLYFILNVTFNWDINNYHVWAFQFSHLQAHANDGKLSYFYINDKKFLRTWHLTDLSYSFRDVSPTLRALHLSDLDCGLKKKVACVISIRDSRMKRTRKYPAGKIISSFIDKTSLWKTSLWKIWSFPQNFQNFRGC